MSTVTLGGDRLGGGQKNKVHLHNYERSSHDMGFIWRNTMSPGTLVPFWTELALPGDTFDIDLSAHVLTLPTNGPLFGTYKLHIDVFQAPIRLYQAQLHQNKLGIGMKMSNVKLPLIEMKQKGINQFKPIDEQGTNPSSILAHLDIRGNGYDSTDPGDTTTRRWNAVPYLAYWEIYKQYYANKQETNGWVVHKDVNANAIVLTSNQTFNTLPNDQGIPIDPVTPTYVDIYFLQTGGIKVNGNNINSGMDPRTIRLLIQREDGTEDNVAAYDIFKNYNIGSGFITFYTLGRGINLSIGGITYVQPELDWDLQSPPELKSFPLANIDAMKESLLATRPNQEPYLITDVSATPYQYPFTLNVANDVYAYEFNQEGLAIRTYSSDLFNNWMNTDWIDGPDGISEITSIDTSGGSFTIDELNLSKKVYDMLNRIAVSGGTYDDWLDAVYTHERIRGAETPIYCGGMIKNIIFQEVISNAQTAEQPLGTIAGRGTLGNMHKGGKIVIRVDEPSFIMGIVSIVPNIDYFQGNKWHMNLRTMDDFHKPQLDAIGFQDLVTDQMAWFDTTVITGGNTPTFKSAGKQPAWLNYMTNINVVRGNFATANNQGWMVLTRRYEATATNTAIKDLSTYIDPRKFNHIFADGSLDAMNFWVQLGIDCTARRKMSAKLMPNL